MELANVAEIKANTYKAFDSLLTKEIMKTNIPLTHISQETGISRTTLTKMRNGELGCTYNLKAFKRFRLFKCFFDVNELNTKYLSFQPILEIESSDSLNNESYDIELSSNKAFSEAFVRQATDPTVMAIYVHSLNNGITQDDIKESFGLNGIRIADELVSTKVLYFSNGTYRAINRSYIDMPKENIKKIITSLSENYKSSHSGQGKNWINFRVDKTNYETIEKIQALHAEFSQKIQDILEEPTARGSVPFYTINQMDTFED